jgi:methylenetetrahydrofolate reductase (NADPH)
VPIIAGISLIKNVEFAKFINKNVPGLNIPEKYVKRLENTKDVKKERVEIACEIIEEIKDFAEGFHFMAFGLEKEIPKILEKTELI